jgi:hypothetical protein
VTCDAPIPQKFNSKGEIVKLFFIDSPQTTYYMWQRKRSQMPTTERDCQQSAIAGWLARTGTPAAAESQSNYRDASNSKEAATARTQQQQEQRQYQENQQ